MMFLLCVFDHNGARCSFTSSLIAEDIDGAKEWAHKQLQLQQQLPTTTASGSSVEATAADAAASAEASTIPVGSSQDEHGSQNSDVPIRVTPASEPEFASLVIECQGYCAWTIVHRQALLLPGNVDLGLIRYHGLYYSFVDEAAMQAFFEFPVKYLEGVHNLVREHPELIQLLGLQDQFPSLQRGAVAGSKTTLRPAKERLCSSWCCCC
jgi:hypothetical protein